MRYAYSSTLSLTSAPDVREWPAPRHGHFNPRGRDPVPIVGGTQGRSIGVRNISLPPGFHPRTVQSLASRYTDYAIPGPSSLPKQIIMIFLRNVASLLRKLCF